MEGLASPQLNRLLRGTLRNKVDPSIVVWVEVQGNSKQGYDLSIDIEASDAIKQRKYDLDKADDRNPFWGIVGQGIRGRSNMGITIKQSAMTGTGILIEEIEENYLPELVIAHGEDWYKSGEEIQVGKRGGMLETLEVLTNAGTPLPGRSPRKMSKANERSSKATSSPSQ